MRKYEKYAALFLIFLATINAVCADGAIPPEGSRYEDGDKFSVTCPENQTEQEGICIYFFYGKGCPHCDKADKYLRSLEGRYDLNIHCCDINSNIELVKKLYIGYEVNPQHIGAVPILFIDETYLLGDTSIIEGVEAEILKCQQKGGCKCPLCDGSKTNQTINETNTSGSDKTPQEEAEISLPFILGLALVDAVNPCELAVLIVLMTAILTRFPKERRKALSSGLAFSLAVFLMYFGFGFLIIYGFKFLVGFGDIGDLWFYKILGFAAIFMGLLNLKDAIYYGGGGFVMEVPQSWRPRMKRLIASVTSTKGAFFVGIAVSFFLTPCTAGPYFVANGILSSLDTLSAFPYLLIYMCIFISPMIAITLIAYFGFKTVEEMGGWREKNIQNLHWIAGLILTGLGAAMVLGLV